MPTFVSPDGNFEVHETCPNGFLTVEQWEATLPAPQAATPTLAEAQTAKRQQINAGFDAAMSASLTMPTASASPSAFEVATAIFEWRTDDPDGYAALVAIHTARRGEMLATVDATTTAAEVQAITVSYAV